MSNSDLTHEEKLTQGDRVRKNREKKHEKRKERDAEIKAINDNAHARIQAIQEERKIALEGVWSRWAKDKNKL